MKKIGLLCFLIGSTLCASEIDLIATVLEKRTLGGDELSLRLVAPASSLEQNENLKIVQTNSRIVREVTHVVNAWIAATDLDRVRAVRKAAQDLDPELRTEFGHIVFEGNSPSAFQTRTLFLIPKKKIKLMNPAQIVFDAVTSYKRSAKKDDFVYEYANAQNLTFGVITERLGSANSWLKPEAALPFTSGSDFALKKCRQILGWRCTTALYHAESYTSGSVVNGAGSESANSTSFILFSYTYDLIKNSDHSQFSRSQAKNQVDGTTAVLLVKETDNWILVFGTDHRYRAEKQSFSGLVQREFGDDTERLKQRIATDLGISAAEIK